MRTDGNQDQRSHRCAEQPVWRVVPCNPLILAGRERHRQGTGVELSWV